MQQSGIQRQVVVSRRDIYPVPRDDDLRIEIRGIAPTDERSQSYKQSILTSLVKQRGTVQALPYAVHNTISIALRIRYRKATVLLGGDVEEEGWKTVLREHRPEELGSQFVKISHHGSTTGYCPGLWSVLSAGGTNKPLVALTPYKRFKLPDPIALDHIKDYASRDLLRQPARAFTQRRELATRGAGQAQVGELRKVPGGHGRCYARMLRNRDQRSRGMSHHSPSPCV